MTPQERQLVADLFARLATLESEPRDADAIRTIQDGLKQAPNAPYALVQTVLVQEEALKRADARIRALEGEDQPREQGGFLDTMRDVLAGGRRGDETPRGSVPNTGGGSRWGTQAAPNPATSPAASPFAQAAPAGAGAPAPGERGGSFLGTAAATAAGVIGGSLLMNSISSMFGHRGQAGGQAFAGEDARSGNSSGDNPWGNASGSDLSRDAGLNDIDGSRSGGDDRRASLFDAGGQESSDSYDDGGDDFDDGFDGDFGGDAA
jgi:hypothetical protein